MRLFTLLLATTLSVYSNETESTFFVQVKNFIWKPISEDSSKYGGLCSLVLCIGKPIDSPSLDNSDCRYLNHNAEFNFSSVVNFRTESTVLWPREEVEITFSVKANKGNNEFTTFAARIKTLLVHGGTIQLDEQNGAFEMEGSMTADCLDENLRNSCSVEGYPVPKLKPIPHPVFGYMFIGMLIFIILISLYFNVIHPKLCGRTAEDQAAKRQNL